jgi:hypothetical protein
VKRVFAAAVLIAAVFGSAPAASHQGALWTAQLAGVEATGMKRLTSAQVAGIAAMKVGTVIKPVDVEAARKRLLDSGYFNSVGFSYRNSGYSLIVIFAVEEVGWKTPVVFDNFVDQTDAQLIAAIAKDVPSFDGVTPDRDVILKRIAAALERVASGAKDPGTVSYALILNTAGRSSTADHWRFRLERASGPLMVCAVALAGVPDPPEGPLHDRKVTLVGTEYSRDQILSFARQTIVPMLPAPAVVRRVEAIRTDACPRGVAVTVTISEAPASAP